MFQIKNLVCEKESVVQKSHDDKSDNRLKKSSRLKKKSKISPSKLVCYKQALRSRLTAKQGMFPQAIKTNILSRNDRTLHSPKISANEEINQRLKNYHVLNKLFREGKPSNGLVFETPSRNVHDESFCMAPHQSPMSVNLSSSPQKSATLSDSMELFGGRDITENLSQLSPVNMTKEMEGARMASADFTYYAPQHAQKVLLYQEVCQIVKKTMIMEKVNHFGNFPDMVQELRNKLWHVRSSRDENFNPDAYFTSRRKASTSDPFSDDELCADGPTADFHSPTRDSGELKTPKCVEMDEVMTSPPFEFKLPDAPDMKKIRGGTGSEAVVDDGAPMDSEDETDEPKLSAPRHRKSDPSGRKYQNSIFCSTLIPTCKLAQNLSMDPIEFLENLSETGIKDFRQSDNELNVYQSAFADSSSVLDNYRSPRRGAANKWLSNSDVGKSFPKDYGRSDLEEFHPRDHRPSRNLDIATKYLVDCTEHDESRAQQTAKPAEKHREILSKPDYVFPSLVSSDTPELKYYPCRLH